MKAKCLCLFFIYLFFCTFQTVLAQKPTGTVKGYVIDSDVGSGIPFAMVKIITEDTIFTVVTDTNGYFRKDGVPVGYVSIHVKVMGYKDAYLDNLLLTAGKELMITIPVEIELVELQEVKIVVEKDRMKPVNEFAYAGVRKINISEATRYAGSFGDPARLASSYAGVSFTTDSRNDVIIRGNSPLGVLWRVEGFNVPSPNHFSTLGTTGGAVSMLNANLLADGDFYVSAWEPAYGNALSGVFDVRLRDGNFDKHEFALQIGFGGVEVDAEGPIVKEKSSFLLSYRYSTLAFFELLGLPITIGATPQYQDLTGKLKFKIGKHSSLEVFGIAGKSYIEILQSNQDSNAVSYTIDPTDIYYGTQTAFGAIKFNTLLNAKTNLETGILLSFAGNNVNIERVISSDSTVPFYTSSSAETRTEWKFQIKHKWNKKHVSKTGVFIDWLKYDYNDSVLLDNNRIPVNVWNGDAYLLQYFFSHKYRLSPRATLIGGVNTTYFTFSKAFAIDPRMAVKIELSSKHEISVGTGLYSMLPPNSLYFRATSISPEVVIYTNKNLKHVRSVHVALQYTYRPSQYIQFSLEPYYQYIFNVPVEINPSPYSMLNEGASFVPLLVDSLVNAGKGKNYGVDITVQRSLKNGFYGLIAVSLYESKYLGSDAIWRNTAFNGNYAFKLVTGKEFVVSKEKEYRLLIDLRVIYAGNRRYIPIDLEKSKILGQEVRDLTRAYQERYPDYFRTDIRIAFRQNFKKVYVESGINIQNLTNHKNVFQYRYDPASQQIVTEYQSGILPVGEFKIYF